MKLAGDKGVNQFFKEISSIFFILAFIALIWISANEFAFSFERTSSFQETNQEQKPPEKSEQEKKADEEEEEAKRSDLERLPAEILKNIDDPFKSPRDEESDTEGVVGVARMSIEELALVAIVETRDEFLALVNGPDNVGYFLRVGDKVRNGIVIEIDMEKVIFEQDIKDPDALKKTRLIVKKIHPEEGG